MVPLIEKKKSRESIHQNVEGGGTSLVKRDVLFVEGIKVADLYQKKKGRNRGLRAVSFHRREKGGGKDGHFLAALMFMYFLGDFVGDSGKEVRRGENERKEYHPGVTGGPLQPSWPTYTKGLSFWIFEEKEAGRVHQGEKVEGGRKVRWEGDVGNQAEQRNGDGGSGRKGARGLGPGRDWGGSY